MRNMINGFLNISRLESGKIIIDRQYFDLEELIIETVVKRTLWYPSTGLIGPCHAFAE